MLVILSRELECTLVLLSKTVVVVVDTAEGNVLTRDQSHEKVKAGFGRGGIGCKGWNKSECRRVSKPPPPPPLTSPNPPKTLDSHKPYIREVESDRKCTSALVLRNIDFHMAI